MKSQNEWGPVHELLVGLVTNCVFLPKHPWGPHARYVAIVLATELCNQLAGDRPLGEKRLTFARLCAVTRLTEKQMRQALVKIAGKPPRGAWVQQLEQYLIFKADKCA